MKKLILLLFPLLFSAQTHRFVYLFQYKKDSLAQDFTKTNMILDVNPDDVKFYPYSYAQTDSLNIIRGKKDPDGMMIFLPLSGRRILLKIPH